MVADWQEEILRLLRVGFSDIEIRQARRILDDIAAVRGTPATDLVPIDVRNMVREACVKYLDEDRDVTVAMIEELVAGQWRDKGPITRARVRNLVKKHLELTRPTNTSLTIRSVEQIERNKIAPRVSSALLRYFKDLPRESALDAVLYEWSDCQVELTASAITTLSNTFVLRVTYTFRAGVGPMYFAVSEDEDLADTICYRYPSIADTFVPSRGCEASVRVAARWDKSERFESIEPTEIGNAKAPNDVAQLVSRDLVKVYAFYPDAKQAGTEAIFRVVSEQTIRLDECYCYWSAPRSLHLTAVRVDFSGFPNRQLYNLRLFRHLTFPVEDYSDPEAGYFELICNEKLRSGGISVRIDWSQKSKP